MRRPRPAAPPSCHAEPAPVVVGEDTPVVALVGSPNVGKSSLFNAITGARRTVGNWPGTTVEVGRGRWRPWDGDDSGREVVLVDLPGAYSLEPASPDEELTADLLVRADPDDRPDLVVVVASAADLSRTLYLARQVRELGCRTLVALTMADLATRQGIEVDADALADALGCAVVVLDPRRREVTALARAVSTALAAPPPHAVPLEPSRSPDPLDAELELAEQRFTWVTAAVETAVRRSQATARRRWSDRLDALTTSPVAGPLLFLVVMWAVFQLTTRVAAPVQDALDALVSGPVSAGVRGALGALGLGGSWVEGLLVDGLVAGVGMVLTFVPLMAIMFGLLAVLEDCGYLARAAVVTDRLMRVLGLPGRAFLPLVVGFGCNVPAVSATRVLPHARQRLLTVLLVPFTSCSARLTVYVLVCTTFFGDRAGDVVFAMYVLSVVLVVLGGLLLRSTLVRAVGNDPLVIDLPRYQLPAPRLLVAVTWMRLAAFLRTAGGVIVVTVVGVWLLSAIPVAAGPQASFGKVAVERSAFGRAAAVAAPVFAPAGFGDWHATGALAVGFVAKEAVVSSWAQTYAAQAPEDPGHATTAGTVGDPRPGSLADRLRTDFARSSGGHVTPAVLAFLVFLLGYTPCVATLAAQYREIGLRWTATGVGLQLVLAWTLAVTVFQVGRLWW